LKKRLSSTNFKNKKTIKFDDNNLEKIKFFNKEDEPLEIHTTSPNDEKQILANNCNLIRENVNIIYEKKKNNLNFNSQFIEIKLQNDYCSRSQTLPDNCDLEYQIIAGI
jgi:hypothetical protein